MNEPDAFPNRSEKEIFFEALDKHTPEERAAFLDGACGKDPARRARVEALLADHFQPDSFMKQPAVEGARPTIRVAPMIEEVAGTVIGRYKLLQQIGEGGCGMVYMAEQEEPVRRQVALKLIKLGMDTKQVIARFEAERQALAMMDHPNIAKVLDAGATEAGRPYFVMELVRGIKITDYCDQNNLSTRERLELFIQVCQAIQHAHQKGIIHRDIKPSNVLVTLRDTVPVPKVIDFGIAKATQQRLTDKTLFTAFQQFIGTPAYMSPEQAEMNELGVDTRSDIYSLGVLLYELLTGRTPFDAKALVQGGLDEIRRIIREEEPVPPSTRLSTLVEGDLTVAARQRCADPAKLSSLIRGDLDWIAMKALEKDRARRYETANGLAMDLQRHLADEPVLARPPSAAYRIHKFVRRNRGMVTAATIIGVVLVLGTFVSTWQAIQATRAKHEQSRLRQAAVANEQMAKTAQVNEAEQRQRAEASERAARQLLYVDDMNLAQQAWDQGNVGRVRDLLARNATYPDRGYEWYFWQRQAHLALQTLRGHNGFIFSVAFSPDGQRIVTGSFDNTAKVWEAASGKELLTLNGHSGPVNSVAFSPDSQRIATASRDGTVRVWNTADGKELSILKGHTNWVNAVAFSLDGRWIVSGSQDQTAKVWEAASGKELLTIEDPRGAINAVAFSPDGSRIITSSDIGSEARVWATANGKEVLTLSGHRACVNAVAFSPDGRLIGTGSLDGTAKVWAATSGQELLTLKGYGSGVAFSPDSARIAAGSGRTVRAWDVSSGEELFALKGHNDRVASVAFSPDGQRIVTGSFDATAKIWEASGARELLTLKGLHSTVRSVAFSPDGQELAGAGWRATKLWATANGKELHAFPGSDGWSTSLSFSPDGRRIVTGSVDGTATVWETASGKEIIVLKGHSNSVWSVAFSPDGQRIATGSSDETARVWNATNGNEIVRVQGHLGGIWAVAFSPDGSRIATGSDNHTAKIWDAASGKELLTLEGHRFTIYSVAFSPDGKQIVTGSDDRLAKVWDAATGKELFTLSGHGDQIHSATFSPDSRRIITGSSDGTVKVWLAASGEELLTLDGRCGNICSVAFSPDGWRIATGGGEAAQVWEAARPEQVAQ